MATNIRGADIVIKTLERAGQTKIFTLSGNHIMSLFDAAIDSKLELYHVRHEAAAVHMADAYGRLTGKPGIAWVTGGPGHANAVGALFTALGQESPMVLLSGHTETDQLGRGGFQELKQVEMAAPVTKASWMATNTATVGMDIAKAGVVEGHSGQELSVGHAIAGHHVLAIGNRGGQVVAHQFDGLDGACVGYRRGDG